MTDVLAVTISVPWDCSPDCACSFCYTPALLDRTMSGPLVLPFCCLWCSGRHRFSPSRFWG